MPQSDLPAEALRRAAEELYESWRWPDPTPQEASTVTDPEGRYAPQVLICKRSYRVQREGQLILLLRDSARFLLAIVEDADDEQLAALLERREAEILRLLAAVEDAVAAQRAFERASAALEARHRDVAESLGTATPIVLRPPVTERPILRGDADGATWLQEEG